jgi:tRNA A-37 threonylcarbamoyl transferase component Bud32
LDDPLLERLRRALAPEFVLDRRIASGGMGIVYLAREVALDRRVAIKVLRPELATARARERFLREARLLARLQHPNIVPVHRADERDGLPFYVMDYVEDRTLADRIANGPLPEPELRRLANDLCAALAAAHAAGIVHRDVKPANIFLAEGRALLGDFGISRASGTDELDLTDAGFAIGTRQYMAPEQLKGREATNRSDQYSAAAALYESATGRAWESLTDPSRTDWRGVPAPMARVLQRALLADPEARWADMAEMRRALRRERFRRRRQLGAAGAVIAAVLLARAGWTTAFPPPPPPDHRNLAILPFTGSGPEEDSLGERLAGATYVNLYGYPSVSAVTTDRSVSWRDAHPNDDAAAARRAFDVDQVVSGTIERRGAGWRLRLVLTDSAGNRNLRAIELPDSGAGPDALGDSAAWVVASALGRRPGTDLRNLAPHSWDAISLFLQGEALFDDDAWQKAADRYAEAVKADPTFVLARWRQLVAQIWSRDFSWDSATALAACCADQLPPLEAGLVRAMSDTNLPRRFHAFDSLNARFGPDGSLPLLFASDLFHRGPLVGRALGQSIAMFENAVDMSPGGTPAPAFDQVIWGKIRLGEREDAAKWLRARNRLATDAEGEQIAQFLQLGYDLRWVHWRARLKLWYFAHFESDDTIKLLGKFYRFSAAFDLPEGQDAVGAVIASRLLSTDRASGLEAQGLARLTWGRAAEGLALIDSAAKFFKPGEADLQRHQWRLMLPVLGAGRATEAEEAAARRWLETQAAAGPLAARAGWTLALDAIQRHDTLAAAGTVARIAAIGATDSSAARLARLAGAVLQGQRDPRGALEASSSLLRYDSPAPGNDIFARSVLHLSRARWHEAMDDEAGAQGEILWYENSDTYRFPVHEAQKMEVDAVASVAARVIRARLLLKTGKRAEACRMLVRVRELWRDADSSVAPQAGVADSLYDAGCR